MESRKQKECIGIGDQVRFRQEIMRVETRVEVSEMKRIMQIEKNSLGVLNLESLDTYRVPIWWDLWGLFISKMAYLKKLKRKVK